MVRVLLKRVGTESIKGCQKEVAKISKIAISSKSTSLSQMSIYSRKEIEDKRTTDYNKGSEGRSSF